MRRFGGGRLVIASHNQGKVREIADLLGPFGADVVSAGELGLDEPEETGETFVANAELKARAAAQASGSPALSDDSGLVVPALGGAPGIHSARWGGEGRDFALAMRKVEEALAGKPDRRAHFVCALSLCWPDGDCATFEGAVSRRAGLAAAGPARLRLRPHLHGRRPRHHLRRDGARGQARHQPPRRRLPQAHRRLLREPTTATCSASPVSQPAGLLIVTARRRDADEAVQSLQHCDRSAPCGAR